MERPTLTIEFKQNLKNFYPEIFARLVYLLISFLVLPSDESLINDKDTNYFIAFFFVLFNVVLFILTLYGTGRRRISIMKYIKMRIISNEKYNKCEIKSTSDFNRTPFYVFVIVSSILFAVSNFVIIYFVQIDRGNPNSIFAIVVIASAFLYGIILRLYRMNFISKGILNITYGDQKYTQKEVEDFMSFLYDDNTKDEIYYLNDGIIYEIDRKANIFKQRIETLLIEAVFIGALTFGTFVELTSPESIQAFMTINKIESIDHEDHRDSSSYYSKNVDKINNQRNSNGVFKKWTEERLYVILSPLYQLIENKTNKKDANYILNILNKPYEDSDLDPDKNITHKHLIKLSSFSDPFEVSAKNHKYILEVLKVYSPTKYKKYLYLTKQNWDEQEYLFLIAIGSIVCSVLYISVLMMRFAIIMRIEGLKAELNKARMWNRREEDALTNKIEAEIEDKSEEVTKRFEENRIKYSEKLQHQLAKCELISTNIETNIQVISFVRNVGLYVFFSLLTIGTIMLDYRFAIILISILIYAQFGSSLLQEGSNLRRLWESFSGTNKHDVYEDKIHNY